MAKFSPQMLTTGVFVKKYRAIVLAEQISGVYCNKTNRERSKVGLHAQTYQREKWHPGFELIARIKPLEITQALASKQASAGC